LKTKIGLHNAELNEDGLVYDPDGNSEKALNHYEEAVVRYFYRLAKRE
jgi:hypothetical protein